MATRSTTKTQTRTMTEVEGAPRNAELTHEEELVVRMSRGLSESGTFQLPMRGRNNAELRARLALIEAGLLAEIHGAGPLAEQLGVAVDEGMKARILAKLSTLDD